MYAVSLKVTEGHFWILYSVSFSDPAPLSLMSVRLFLLLSCSPLRIVDTNTLSDV